MAIPEFSHLTKALVLVTALQFFPSFQCLAHAGGPRVYFNKDGHCPPKGEATPKEGFDMIDPGPPPTVKGWLIERFHWVDGHNDLTVESFCMTKNNSLTLRISQSKDDNSTVIAGPDGGSGRDPGDC